MILGYKLPLSNDYICSLCEIELETTSLLEVIDDKRLESLPYVVVCGVCDMDLLGDKDGYLEDLS